MEIKKSGSFPFLKAAAEPRKKPTFEESKQEAKKLNAKDKVSISKFKRAEHLVPRLKESITKAKISRRSQKKRGKMNSYPTEVSHCLPYLLMALCGHLCLTLEAILEKLMDKSERV